MEMTDLQKWYNTFEENHKDDPIYIEVANSIDLEISVKESGYQPSDRKRLRGE